MKKMKVTAIMALFLMYSALAESADNVPSVEQRIEMAKQMESMAACLRSTKPIQECHDEMRKSCEEQMDAGGCMMMDGHMGRKGHGYKLRSKPDSKSSQK